MKRQLLALVALIAVQTAVFLVLAAPGARADEPLQQGWWTIANPGGPSLPAPPPSDVPSNGLLVQGGAAGPTAFAAVVYSLAQGVTVGQLTLTVARPSATTPDAKLEVCPLTSASIAPEQGGPMSDAPKYDCAHEATASPSADGKTYAFSVSSLVSNGSLAVAIVPTTSSERVVFSNPGASSLPVTQPIEQPPPPANSAPGPASSPAPMPPAGGASLAGAPPVGSGSSLPGPATTAPAPQVAPSPTPTTTPQPGGFAAASTTSGPGKASPTAVGLTLGGVAVAAALWAYAGRNKEGTEGTAVEQA